MNSIKISKLRWSEKLKRMEENEIPKRVLEYKVQGRRSVGRPRFQWEDSIRRGVQRIGGRIGGLWPRIGTLGEGSKKKLWLDPGSSATDDDFIKRKKNAMNKLFYSEQIRVFLMIILVSR